MAGIKPENFYPRCKTTNMTRGVRQDNLSASWNLFFPPIRSVTSLTFLYMQTLCSIKYITQSIWRKSSSCCYKCLFIRLAECTQISASCVRRPLGRGISLKFREVQLENISSSRGPKHHLNKGCDSLPYILQ